MNRPQARNALDAAVAEAVARAAVDWTWEEGWGRQAALTDPVVASEDAREGWTAFAGKRAPVWKGR